MKIYGWVPESYGEWAYVLAESPEAAKEALVKSKTNLPVGMREQDRDYYVRKVDDFLSRPPDEAWEPGEVIFGEYA